HPATTTHGRLSPEDKARAGITENLIRLSVGIESIKDLKTDLDRGFQALKD
ncbi:MAG TPA: O-succinylhomoserine sulfhydrylase, partial [Marinobacter hydrocarbonoclasticus]|nr:O-succinylhomoserine sulfhydrylase [Marinobacter nauticus]